MEDSKKLIRLILSKDLRLKVGITDEHLKKLLREYHLKNIAPSLKVETDPNKIFDGGLGL